MRCSWALIAFALVASVASHASAWPLPVPSASEIVDRMEAAYAAAGPFSDDVLLGGNESRDRSRLTLERRGLDEIALGIVSSGGNVSRDDWRGGPFEDAITVYSTDDEDLRVENNGASRLYPDLAAALTNPYDATFGSGLRLLASIVAPARDATRERLRGATVSVHEDLCDCWQLDVADAVVPLVVLVDRETLLVRQIWAGRDGRQARFVLSGTLTTIVPAPVRTSLHPALEIRGDTTLSDRVPRSKAWIGVVFEGSTTRVTHVIPGTPAAQIGMQAGDVLVSTGGRSVGAAKLAQRRWTRRKPGDALEVSFVRAGTKSSHQVVLAEKPGGIDIQRAYFVGRGLPGLSAVMPTGRRWSPRRDVPRVLFYTASWCRECVQAATALETWRRAHPGVDVVAITDELPEYAAALARDHHLGYPVLVDGDRSGWRALLMARYGTTFVLDGSGVVREVHEGFDAGAVEKALGTR